MLEETKKFYELNKVKEIVEASSKEIPITWTHIFHKEYPRMPSLPLIKSKEESELEALFELRESSRIFSEEPIKYGDLSKILLSCRIVNKNRGPEKRTYPSAGARFPVEQYIISFNIDGLEKGAYHYNLERERLELLLKKDLCNSKRDLISPYLENPAGTVVFTSVISRSEVKYGHKAYQFSFIEAGHMGQNILLAATQLGLGVCPVSGFIDSSIKEILDLTDDEIPLYTISFGKRKLIS